MTNNDCLRRLRYIFDYGDDRMIKVFALAEADVNREQVSKWLKKEGDTDYQSLNDTMLATFLNGLINHKRGKREGEQPKPEVKLNNNVIFMKIKIALNLKSEDILELLSLANLRVSKHELSAFFRRADHKHYRVCKDQILRNFLNGLQLKHRETALEDDDEEDTVEEKASFAWKQP